MEPITTRDMVSQISAATGIPATTSTLAYLDAFKAFGISRVGLVSPYTQDVNDAIIRGYRTEGMTITGERHLGLSINEYFARVEPSELLAPSAELADGSGNSWPQALIYLCTNLYGAPVVQQVEQQSDAAVLDSVAVTLWQCLAMTGAAGLDPR
ncbi:hypothetical protein [Paenarthrobacter sp. PH39-S1]|uniref:aspartate racemase/maleate isomerase family protein n=1 Tax=Paenarthrobacter sp. PH39-S1 TaxID=3046204 RepID=UPI0024BB9DA0|nr:hypothetical protein [Paenarthrobacter sp. PH39-S1]MDJ0357789.1 hypothetical protein [Paenarthrobacter sp. PH39-S1]